MLNNKLSKKVAISALSATLVLSSISITSAATTYRDSLNRTFVYKTTATVSNNTAYTNSLAQYLRRYNIRIINRSTNVQEPQAPAEQPKAPVEQPQAPVEQPKAPVQQPQQPVSNSRHSLTSNEVKLVEYVNSARADAGLAPLAIDVDLSYVARVKSQDMHDNNYFSHTSPTYGSPFDMMKKFGIQYRSAAENIARTSSVESAHNGFMNSEGHRRNIMNPSLTHIGIGIYNGYYTQMFIQK